MAMAALSDRGKVRPINEDSFCLPNGQMYLALVADGMGGHQAGEVASDMAASILSELAAKRGGKDISVKTAVSWVRKANAAIYASAQANPAQRGMGTTLTFLYFMHQRVMLGHVGDSRCYRLRDGQLAQLSTDHSLVQELVRNGTITQEEARNHPYKNIITRALGADEQVQVDAHDLQLSRSDVFLLCSDGLTDYLTDEELQDILLEQETDLQQKARKMVDIALERGGRDNITVLLLDGEVAP